MQKGNSSASEVCDFLVSVIADELKLKVFVYQEKLVDGSIQLFEFTGDNAEKEVHLRFKHNDLRPGGNHYDCVIRTSESKKREKEKAKKQPEIQPVPEAEPKKKPPQKGTVYSRPDVPDYFKRLQAWKMWKFWI